MAPDHYWPPENSARSWEAECRCSCGHVGGLAAWPAGVAAHVRGHRGRLSWSVCSSDPAHSPPPPTRAPPLASLTPTQDPVYSCDNGLAASSAGDSHLQGRRLRSSATPGWVLPCPREFQLALAVPHFTTSLPFPLSALLMPGPEPDTIALHELSYQ